MDDKDKRDIPEPPCGRKPQRQSLLKNYAVIIASIIIILAGLHASRSILGPFLMAAFFSVLLISPINWLKSKGLAQWLALTIVIIGVAIIGGGSATVVGAQLAQFARNIPTYRNQFNEKLQTYNLQIEDFLPQFLRDGGKKPSDSGEEQEGENREEQSPEVEAQPEPDAQTRMNRFQKSPGAAPFAAQSAPAPIRQVAHLEAAPVVIASVHADPEPVAVVEPDLAVEPSELEIDATPNDAAEAVDAATDEIAARGILPEDADSSFTPPDRPDDASLAPPEADSRFIVDDGADALASDEETAEDEDASDDVSIVPPVPSWRSEQPSITAVDASLQTLFRFLGSLAGELSYFASTAFLITLLVIFMLVETAKIPAKLVAVLGERRFTNTHIDNILKDIRNYMVIKTWMSLLVGVSVTILFTITKVEYAILWGFVAFLLNYIPNIGSTVAAIPPVVLASVDHGLFMGGVVTVVLVIINCIVGYYLEPRLLGKGLDLSPLIVLISLILFGWLLGPVGMFLSPPLAVVMKIIFQSFPETEWIAALMANRLPRAAETEEAA